MTQKEYNEVISCYLKQNSDIDTLVDLAGEYGIKLSNTEDLDAVVDDTMAFFSKHKKKRADFPWDYGCDFIRVCNECHDWMSEGYYVEDCIIDDIFLHGYWCSDKCLRKKITEEQWKYLASSAETREEMSDPNFIDEGNDYAYYTEWKTGEDVVLPDGKIARV